MAFLKSFLDTFSHIAHFKINNEHNLDDTLEKIENIENNHNNAEIKDFLGLPNSSTATTKNSVIDERLNKKKIRHINSWFQWTCSKISLKLFDKNVESSEKLLVFEIEDVMFSMDQQDVYFKVKAQVVSVSCEFFELTDSKWIKNSNLSLSVQSDESDLKKNTETFFDVIITKAETGNVHSKWGTFKKNRSLNESLTEIIVNIQHIDIIVNFDKLLLFQPILSELLEKKQKIQQSKTKSNGFACISDLPLLHLKSSGFRVFVPCLIESNSLPNVLILKVKQSKKIISVFTICTIYFR